MRARTKKKPKKSRLLPCLLFLLFCGLFGYGVYYVISLPLWNIQEVVISGNNLLDAQQLKNIASIPLYENLWLTSFQRARRDLRTVTAIKDFHIYRIPPATVLISIKERKPLVVIVYNGKSAIVDDEGYILNHNRYVTISGPSLTDLPVISGIGSIEVDKNEKIDPHLARVISEIIVELSNLIGSRQIQLELGGFQKITFRLNDILQVKLGRDEEIKTKMAVFKKLLPVIENKWPQIEYVDVRFPDNPVVKYK